MKKKLTVKQKHRYTHESHTLYSGEADFQKSAKVARISYIEDGSACKVLLELHENGMELQRIGTDMKTRLSFRNREYTEGVIASSYGEIPLGIFTHTYINKDEGIAVEYDILVNGEVTDGYRILWKLREDVYESN